MLSKFFDPAHVERLRGGPTGAFLEDFAQALVPVGYARDTACHYIRAAQHFMDWAGRHGEPVSFLTEASLDRFGHHLQHCQCADFGCGRPDGWLRGARLFLTQMQRSGFVSRPIADPVPCEPRLLSLFREWMRQQRNTSDRTLENYNIHVRALLKHFGEDATFDARALREFVMQQNQQCAWTRVQTCTTALRMFVRFLIAQGQCRAGLENAIPVIAHWRLASLPRYLPPEDVERLIDSCNSATPVGRRDRAILLLLARLGLRAGDIVTLRLGDIDWKEAHIRVCGKGRREARLPLTQEVGDALVAYLKNGRPATELDTFFLCSVPPVRAFSSHVNVSYIVDAAIRRAGVQRPSRGAAHLLRHSAATALLRQGASLQDIGTLLRHRSLRSSEIYAKVDVNALQQIVQPWPQVPSC